MYSAINLGLRAAVSRWLAYVNSDDVIYPGPYAEMIQTANNMPHDIVYGAGDYIDSAGRYLYTMTAAPERYIPALLAHSTLPFVQPGTIFTRDIYHAVGGFDSTYRYCGDHDFFLRCLNKNARYYRFRRGPVTAFRLSPTQLSVLHADRMVEELSRLRSGAQPQRLDQVWLAIARWKLQNIENYIIRCLRRHDLTGSWSIPRSLQGLSQ
jgi:hypothetical protein